MLYTYLIANQLLNTMVVFEMCDSVPSARYCPVCNVLRLWRIWLIPTYRVYRLYDIAKIRQIQQTRVGSLLLTNKVVFCLMVNTYVPIFRVPDARGGRKRRTDTHSDTHTHTHTHTHTYTCETTTETIIIKII